MDAATETKVYERTLSIDASPETVWQFLVDPEKLMRWKGINADLDAQPGGIYYCEVIPGHKARGEFVELDKPNRLVFTFGWEGNDSVPPGSSTIEIELASEGEGTSLRFVHNLPSAEAVASHTHGWDHYLPRLELAAAGKDPGADEWSPTHPACDDRAPRRSRTARRRARQRHVSGQPGRSRAASPAPTRMMSAWPAG